MDYVETWKALEDCVDEGLVKDIGLSNFNSDQIQRILDIARIKPSVNQVQFWSQKLFDLTTSYTYLILISMCQQVQNCIV